MQFNIHYAKLNLSRLLELVERGEEVVIALRGQAGWPHRAALSRQPYPNR
jgi:hypothetical protein